MNQNPMISKGYVARADGSRVVLREVPKKLANELLSSGFTACGDELAIEVGPDPRAKAEVFAKLRDEGLAFAGGREWSPSDVFDYLRSMSLLSGQYRELLWKGPDQPLIRPA